MGIYHNGRLAHKAKSRAWEVAKKGLFILGDCTANSKGFGKLGIIFNVPSFR